MKNILSGLKNLGLGSLEEADLYEEDKKEGSRKKPPAPPPPKLQEKDLIYEKSFTCPVCDSSFTAKLMKSGKAKSIGSDQDLRVRYEGIDANKYDIVMCPICGYAAMNRYFTNVTSMQAKAIREKISMTVCLTKYEDEIYSYEEAMERHKLALASAVVKHAKTSEKAYICLKTAWLFRGYRESLVEKGEGSEKQLQNLEGQEEEFLASAYKGLKDARQTEPFPICGMNTVTVDYLVAVLAIRFKEYDVAAKLMGAILTSPSATSRVKDKVRDLKEQVIQEVKSGKGVKKQS